MPTNGCPTRHDLRQLATGVASDELADRIEVHQRTCVECRDALTALEDAAFGVVRSAVAASAEGETQSAEVNAILSTLQTMELSRRPLVESARSAPPTNVPGYQLQALIARGGIGEVWRARDRQTRKDVAIKLLHHVSRRSLRRFLREMQIVEDLDHPNIVRSYHAGHAGGQPYLVMEYIVGANLSDLERACRPMAMADACELVRQLAIGVDYVHRTGNLIHRDIKPANAMLDEDGSVKVLDLGLAAFRDQEDASAELTNAGDVLGTLAYMAPEQLVGGQAVGVATDIHGLGATLYRLLVGRSPFGHRRSIAERLEAVRSGDYIPLDKAREALPDALVSLVRRMLAFDVKARPSSASDVADALEPFAAEADLASLAARARRLHDAARAKQQPLRASISLFAAGVVAATCLLALGFFLWPRTEPSVSSAAPATHSEVRDEPSEDQRRALAVMRKTVEELSDMIAHDPNLNEPEMLPRRREMLARLREMYVKTRDNFGSRPEMLRDLADAYHSLAVTTLTVDSPREALAVFEQELELGRELESAEPDDAATHNILARSFAGIGVMWLHLGDNEKALAGLTQAVHQFDRLVQQHPEDSGHRVSLSQSYLNLAALHEQTGDADASIAACKQGVAALRPLLDAEPDNGNYARLLALHYQNLGAAHLIADDTKAAIAAFDEAVLIFRQLVTVAPEVQENHGRLGMLLVQAGKARFKAGDFDGAESILREAIAIEQQLQRENPGARAYERDQCIGLTALAKVLHTQGKHDEASETHKQAVALARKVLTRDPTVADSIQQVTETYEALIEFHQHANDTTAVESAERQLEELLQGRQFVPHESPAPIDE